MPNLESEAISAQLAAMADLMTMSSILEELHLLTSEHVEVTYEQRLVEDLPRLWVGPTDASSDQANAVVDRLVTRPHPTT